MIVKLLTEHHLEFLCLKGGCRGSSESTHVKMPHCWKSHVMAQLFYCPLHFQSLMHKVAADLKTTWLMHATIYNVKNFEI